MSKIENAVKLFGKSPTLFWRKTLVWGRRHCHPKPLKQGTIRLGEAVFPYNLDLGSSMSDIYYGGYEPDICLCFERLLSPGDIFLDVGANVGYLSALGLGLVGKTGQVHSFEPVPWLYKCLSEVAKVNEGAPLFCNQTALGESSGTASISTSKWGNIGWNTMVPNFMPPEDIAEQFQVPVIRLDDYILRSGIQRVDLIKIDVEGFEIPVLKGLTGYLEKHAARPAILCEVASGAYPKLGMAVADLEAFRQKYGYEVLDPISRRQVSLLALTGTTNVLFVPPTPS